MDGEVGRDNTKLKTVREFTWKPPWDVITCVIRVLEKESERN